MKFAEKEAAIHKEQALIEEKELIAEAARIRQKANLNAELELLSQQKELEACVAETNILEMKSEHASVKSELELPQEDPMEMVEKFIDKQYNSMQQQGDTEHCEILEPSTIKKEIQDPVDNTGSNDNKSPSYTEDLVKFLLRKDLTLSRLYIFNDKPETYKTWKSSFSQVMKEMSVNPSEEMDLLVKWLGVESRKFALSIRSANTHDPGKGLKRIWERLDERFGSPEMVHSVLIKKLHEFPKIGPKDSVKLYELSDILTEIESLKEDPKYATLLAYFDSSVGVSPVVAKLPYNLQEKWTTRANSFKRVHMCYISKFLGFY